MMSQEVVSARPIYLTRLRRDWSLVILCIGLRVYLLNYLLSYLLTVVLLFYIVSAEVVLIFVLFVQH